jgi:hypothetical protein
MAIYASFKSNGDLLGYGNLEKSLAEIRAIKEVGGVTAFSITANQYDLLTEGQTASESGGVITVTEPAGWLENKTNEAWRKIRKERNQLLKDSDYIMFPDITITAEKKEEWTTYRQSLRDIPQTFSNPDDVTYPDKPE